MTDPSRTPQFQIRVLIAFIAAIGLALVIAAIAAFATARSNDPLVLGLPSPSVPTTTAPSTDAPTTPEARDPLVCAQRCFDRDSTASAFSSDESFVELKQVLEMYPWGAYSSPTSQIVLSARVEWPAFEMEPADCFFTAFEGPVVAPLQGEPVTNELDVVEYTAERMDKQQVSLLQQSARLLDDSASAEAHITSLHEQIQGCTEYRGADGLWRSVRPAPALDLPGSVAATSWIEERDGRRFLAYDLQRGSMVVRSTLSVPTEDVTEAEYAAFVEDLAVGLAQIEPIMP